jgi:hypothetical protein
MSEAAPETVRPLSSRREKMDTQKIRTLLDKREEIDRELVELVSGNVGTSAKKSVKCSHCAEEGHTARNCPHKHQANGQTTTVDAFAGQ